MAGSAVVGRDVLEPEVLRAAPFFDPQTRGLAGGDERAARMEAAPLGDPRWIRRLALENELLAVQAGKP